MSGRLLGQGGSRSGRLDLHRLVAGGGDDRNAPRLHRFGYLARQLDVQKAILKGRVGHLDEIGQLKAALDAYATRNAAAAVEVCNSDEEIDALYTSLFRELLTYMMEDPRNITQCTHLLFCSKSLERVGDHATNIAEAAFYLDTGRQMSEQTDELHRTQIKE